MKNLGNQIPFLACFVAKAMNGHSKAALKKHTGKTVGHKLSKITLAILSASALNMTSTVQAQDAEKDMKKAGRLIGSYRLDPTANADKLPEAKSLIDGAK